MTDPANPSAPPGSRMKGHTLRLVSSFLVGLLVMLVTGVIGVPLSQAVMFSVGAAVVFWLCWVATMRLWMRRKRHAAT